VLGSITFYTTIPTIIVGALNHSTITYNNYS